MFMYIIRICVCTYMYMCVYIHVCICVCTYMCMYIYMECYCMYTYCSMECTTHAIAVRKLVTTLSHMHMFTHTIVCLPYVSVGTQHPHNVKQHMYMHLHTHSIPHTALDMNAP